MKDIKKYIVVKNKIITKILSDDIHDVIDEDAIYINNTVWEYISTLDQCCLKNNKKENLTIEDIEEYHEDIVLNEEEKKIKQINELENWFKWYDYQMIKYSRYVRLGLQYNNDISELDKQAQQNANILKKLKKGE